MDNNTRATFKRILDIVKGKGIFIVFIITALFMVVGYFYSYYYIVPKYQATETLLLIPNNNQEQQVITSTDLNLNSELLLTYTNIAKQSKVLKQVIQNLNLDITEQELLEQLQVNTTTNSYIIEIVVSNENAYTSVDIAKELSNVFLNEIKQIYNLENIGIVDEAEIPETPYNINHIKDLIMFFAAGVFVSAVVIFGIYLLDDTVKTEEEVSEYIGLKTLGKVPVNAEKEEIIVKHSSKSYITECINTLRTNILYMNSAKTAKTILITSCKEQEGKSFVSTNIAASFAETNKKVLIIDADMRKGRLNKIFKLSNEEGLSNYLYAMTEDKKENLLLAKKYIKETEINNLHVLTKGSTPPNPSELLNSNSMKTLLQLLSNVYDIIIVDSPPCTIVTDSIVLSTIVDSAILVVNAGKTKLDQILDAKKSIKMVGGNLLGVVLNKIEIKGKSYSKAYYYGHSKENKCEAVEHESYTVEKLIDENINKLDMLDLKELPEAVTEENSAMKQSEEEQNNNSLKTSEVKQNNKTNKLIEAQNKYLEKLTDAVLKVKEQLNQNEEKNNNMIKDFKEQLAKTELNTVGITESIKEQLDENQNNNISTIESLANTVLNIKKQLDEDDTNRVKIMKEQLAKIELDNENRAEEMRKYLNQNELSNSDRIRNIEEMINALQEKLEQNDQAIETNMKELKDNYDDISNKISTMQQPAEIYEDTTGKIVNINKFKQEKKLKKRTYSLDEEIPYSDLEKSAVCVISFNNGDSYNDYEESIGVQ